MMRATFSRSAAPQVSTTSQWLWIGLTVLTLVASSGCSAPSSPDPQPQEPGQPPSTTTASDLVDATNAERSRAGMRSLTVNGRLMEAARVQAEQVAAAGRLEHTLPEARLPSLEDRLAAAGYDWQEAGENLAYGQRNAAHAVDTWMQSPGHRVNILSATFTEIGAGYVVDPTGRPYYVQVFGRQR